MEAPKQGGGVAVQDLLKAGAHFGHLTRRWNPKMKHYIFMERNGIHIIDLRQTKTLLDEACATATRIASKGRTILFVGTKKQAQEAIREEADRAGMPYVCERWLGGMLTNYQTIKKSIRRMENIEKMETDGTFEQLKKKERLMKTREKEKLKRTLTGIANMSRLPHAIFVVDIRREHIAVNEARKLGIPVIAIVDTNCDPDLVNFPVPANDDALKSIKFICSTMADAILEGSKVAEQNKKEAPAAKAKRDADLAEEAGEAPKRTRKRPSKAKPAAKADKPAKEEAPAKEAKAEKPAKEAAPAKEAKAEKPAKEEAPAKEAKAEKPAKEEAPAKEAKAEKPAKAEKAEKPAKEAKAEKAEKPAKAEKAEPEAKGEAPKADESGDAPAADA